MGGAFEQNIMSRCFTIMENMMIDLEDWTFEFKNFLRQTLNKMSVY